ncbi:MAG: Crp/Fnr family transcriptional regulator [Peptococcaceae bacterium]|nr:Crp/Fnr family transcriptional regulator [Peptococcaceae bacterium]
MKKEIKGYRVVIPDTFFPVEKFNQFIHLGSVKRYSKGSAVVLPGDKVQKLIYVISGRLRISMITDDERERLIYFAGKNCVLGLLFTECSDVYAVAMENSQVCLFSEHQVRQIFQMDQDIVFDILKNYQSKVSYYMKQVTEMDYFNPTVRVVRLLHQLCISQGVEVGNSYEVNIELTMKSISEITGAHYVTVSKVLGCLKKQKILEKKKDKIIIHNLERLNMLTHETQILKKTNI